MNKMIFTVVGFAVGVALMSSAALAETVLSVSSWLPPKHPIVANMIKPWMANVEKSTNGNVKIKLLAKGLGKPPAHFDIARDGLADITYGVHGYTPGRFILTKAAEVPFLADDAESLSVAYWRVHEKMLASANEHKGVQLLSVFTHGPGVIYNSKKAINSVADLKGMKFRVGGGLINNIAKNLSIVPLYAPAPKSYEILSNGLADGIMFPKESIKSFKLLKLLPYVTYVPGGLYNTSFFLVMNSSKFKSLSAADQKAIMSVSGEAFARLSGKAWDAADAEGLAAMKASGVDYRIANAVMVSEIKKLSDPVVSKWATAAKKRTGIDGSDVVAALRAEVPKAK